MTTDGTCPRQRLERQSLCGGGTLYTLRRIVTTPFLIPGIVSAWILVATMFLLELSLSVVLSRPGTEVPAVQVVRFAEDDLWGKLSALGILMILVSTTLAALASLVGATRTKVEKTG